MGAYPSARFALIDKVSDVPVADNLGPFESERWFDGGRVRKQPSARELEDLFLGPLSVDRTKCRITDLVKIFLFKKGHIRRYSKLKAVAKPVFVITLGAEVAGILRGVRSASAQSKLLVPEVSSMGVGDISVPTMHCAHPGILMRTDPMNLWPSRHKTEFIKALKKAQREFGF